MKKDFIIIILKVLVYACGLFLAYFGVSSLTSCSVSHDFDAYGKTIITTSDTTFINHNGYVRFPKK